MLTKYCLELKPDRSCRPHPEWGYRLYAALLEQLPPQFAREAHGGDFTPVSQFLEPLKGGGALWHVSLLGRYAEEALSASLDGIGELRLDKDGVRLSVTGRSKERVSDADELLDMAAGHGGVHALRFCTPTAFKSRGEYVNLPTPRLMVQSLVRKWNGCIRECPIEDEDGEGLEAMWEGLRCRSFRLHDRMYHLKGSSVPGFAGEATFVNRLSGFHRQLLDALLLFADCSGIGIKTTLGMGGVVHLPWDRS